MKTLPNKTTTLAEDEATNCEAPPVADAVVRPATVEDWPFRVAEAAAALLALAALVTIVGAVALQFTGHDMRMVLASATSAAVQLLGHYLLARLRRA